DEDHGVRLLERGIDLLLDERPQLPARAEPAGIDHEVRSAAEASVAVAPITREAGVIGNERVAGPRQSIEERRLAYVGPADQRDGGEHRVLPKIGVEKGERGVWAVP